MKICRCWDSNRGFQKRPLYQLSLSHYQKNAILGQQMHWGIFNLDTNGRLFETLCDKNTFAMLSKSWFIERLDINKLFDILMKVFGFEKLFVRLINLFQQRHQAWTGSISFQFLNKVLAEAVFSWTIL